MRIRLIRILNVGVGSDSSSDRRKDIGREVAKFTSAGPSMLEPPEGKNPRLTLQECRSKSWVAMNLGLHVHLNQPKLQSRNKMQLHMMCPEACPRGFSSRVSQSVTGN